MGSSMYCLYVRAYTRAERQISFRSVNPQKKQASETAFPMPAAHNIKKKKLFLRDFGVAFVDQGDDFARDVVCRIDEKRAVFI